MTVLAYRPRPWQPLQRSTVSEEEMARLRKLHAAYSDEPPQLHDESWANDEYQVFVTFAAREDGSPGSRDGLVWLSIKRNDRQPVNDWREKQAIKNEVCGVEREAIEVYPAESRLVDAGDQAHLWVLPVGEPVPLGFQMREVLDDAERRAALAAGAGDVAASKGSQRAWRPGLPTGRELDRLRGG